MQVVVSARWHNLVCLLLIKLAPSAVDLQRLEQLHNYQLNF